MDDSACTIVHRPTFQPGIQPAELTSCWFWELMSSFLIPSLAAIWIASVAACTSAEFLVKLKI